MRSETLSESPPAETLARWVLFYRARSFSKFQPRKGVSDFDEVTVSLKRRRDTKGLFLACRGEGRVSAGWKGMGHVSAPDTNRICVTDWQGDVMTDQKTMVQKNSGQKNTDQKIADQKTTPTMNKNKTTMTGAGILWECLEREGVKDVFGYPGGAILPAYDALKHSKIHHILVRHEQGATHMADGYARASGEVGVAVATSGPGATNMVTGIGTAML